MELKNYILGRWEFIIKMASGGYLCTINRYDREGYCEFGFTGDWKTREDSAVISTVDAMLADRQLVAEHYADAQEALAAAYATSLIGDFIVMQGVCPRSFAYKGAIWSVCPDDMHPDRPCAIGPRLKNIYNIKAFDVDDTGKTALGLMWADARAEGEELAKTMDALEEDALDYNF